MKSNTNAKSLWIYPHLLFIGVSFAFSWLIWIVAWLISERLHTGGILFNADLIWAPLSGGANIISAIFLVSLLSLTGVYGPALGAYVASKFDKDIFWQDIWARSTQWRSNNRYLKKVLIILTAVIALPSVATIFFTSLNEDAPGLLGFSLLLLVFFLVQVITSGTEEIGWRGYLTEKLLPGRNFWDTGWLVGIVWAVWHFPVLLIMFIQEGMVHVQILGSLAGFTMGIVAMAILHTWFYEQTRQVSLNIFIHALFNAIPLTLVVMYIESPVAVLSNILLWIVVLYIKYIADKSDTRVIMNR